MLTTYQTQTQRLLHDTSGSLYPLQDITYYINVARSQLAIETECVRFLYGWDGLYLTGDFQSGTSTILNVSSIANVVAGQQIFSVNVPAATTVLSAVGTTITMTPNTSIATQTAATFQLIPSLLAQTNNQQEQYPFPANMLPSQGIKDVIQVISVSVNWGGNFGSNMYTLDYWDFSSFQAYLRFYGVQGLRGNPAVWTRYNKSVYIRPVPSQSYPMQWDTCCSVVDLTDDNTTEAIPYPFTDAVPFYAAYFALMNGQRKQDAALMFEEYEKFIRRARAFVQRQIIPSMYTGMRA